MRICVNVDIHEIITRDQANKLQYMYMYFIVIVLMIYYIHEFVQRET